jgi:hypothetical protein
MVRICPTPLNAYIELIIFISKKTPPPLAPLLDELKNVVSDCADACGTNEAVSRARAGAKKNLISFI